MSVSINRKEEAPTIEHWCTPVIRGHDHKKGPAKEVTETRSKVRDGQERVDPKRKVGTGPERGQHPREGWF